MNSQIIIRWSQGHATSNYNEYKLNRHVPQQKYRLGTVSNTLLGVLQDQYLDDNYYTNDGFNDDMPI